MPNHHHQHEHHLHGLDDVHYDISTHDNYRAHHHEWAGNQFNTVADNDHPFGRDFDCCADDHELDTPGDDHKHPGFDIRWADNNPRAAHPAGTGVPPRNRS